MNGFAPSSHPWVRMRAWIWRFGVLPFVRKQLLAAPFTQVATRRFAGGRLSLELGRSDTHRLLLAEGERFVLERRELCRLAGIGDTVVDVGANIGYIALLLRQAVGPSGRVICLEPIPENLAELRRNIVLNDLGNVESLEVAAGEVDGVVRMSRGLNGVVAEAAGDLEVVMKRLDTLDVEAPDLVKIDVEGYELSVLRGASGWLRDAQPSWWIEIHPQLVPDPDDPAAILALLREHGYKRLCAMRPTSDRRALRTVVARYLGLGALERTSRPEEWLAAAPAGGRQDPFWLSARRSP